VSTPVVHGLAAVPWVRRHDVLGQIDRRFCRLELLPVVHDDPGFGKLGAELIGVLVGDAGWRVWFPAQPPVGSSPRERGATKHEREASSHGRDAIVSPPPASPAVVPFPGGRIR
jgi:hypothetical protein